MLHFFLQNSKSIAGMVFCACFDFKEKNKDKRLSTHFEKIFQSFNLSQSPIFILFISLKAISTTTYSNLPAEKKRKNTSLNSSLHTVFS